MNSRIVGAIALALLLGACSTRSISNSGYQADRGYGGTANPFYQGEIDTLDLLVPASQGKIDQPQIDAALAHHEPVTALLGQPLLVIQSGALVPDAPMVSALGGHFNVTPFSGIPTREQGTTPSQSPAATYGERLRLAAAEGGYRRIFVYWGQLEASQTNGPAKVVSWVPIIGSLIPDESQKMRIVLNAAIIDVASGRWTELSPEPVSDDAISASINRESSDQEQVEKLKEASYARLAALVIERAKAFNVP
jgi:hypothetical protein